MYQFKLDNLQKYLEKWNYPYKVDYYTDPDAWKEICKRDDIDLVVVATPPTLHVPIATYAMKCGKHVAVEVPIIASIEDAWKIVDTAEQTQRHCIMLENVNYGDYELAMKNMVTKELFGVPVHAEAGYLHNLEEYRFDFSDKTNWRTERPKPEQKPMGMAYPTHGLGPVAHWMGINRGDRMTTVVSVDSGDFTMHHAADMMLGPKHDMKEGHFRPDQNLSIIKTAKGKTILMFYSTVFRQPYTRAYKLNGTRGFAEDHSQHKDVPTTCQRRMGFEPNFHDELQPAQINKLLKKYRHDIYTRFEAEAKKYGGHGGMDTVMILRLMYCLNNGLPLDIDVYDGVSWSAVAPATAKSVELGSIPVEIPDFTRGAWETMDKVDYYYVDDNGVVQKY